MGEYGLPQSLEKSSSLLPSPLLVRLGGGFGIFPEHKVQEFPDVVAVLANHHEVREDTFAIGGDTRKVAMDGEDDRTHLERFLLGEADHSGIAHRGTPRADTTEEDRPALDVEPRVREVG